MANVSLFFRQIFSTLIGHGTKQSGMSALICTHVFHSWFLCSRSDKYKCNFYPRTDTGLRFCRDYFDREEAWLEWKTNSEEQNHSIWQ